MFGTDFIERLPERFAGACLFFIKPSLDAADGVQHVCKRGGILHNQFRPAIYG